MKRIRYGLFSSTLLFVAGFAAAADVDSLIQTCDGCHGDGGVSQWSDVPTIAGIDEFSHSDALYIYQDEARPCAESEFRQGDTSRAATNMCKLAQDLDDDLIEAIAAYYGALPFVAAKQEFDAAQAATGKDIHEKSCGMCHSDGGSNPEDAMSILAGQHMAYLERVFSDYASGEREQVAKMKQEMDALSDDDVKALLHYYASQQ